MSANLPDCSPPPPVACPQASCILQLVKYIQKLQQKDVEVAEEVIALFDGELNPVAPKAQKKVPVPEGYVFPNTHTSSYQQYIIT